MPDLRDPLVTFTVRSEREREREHSLLGIVPTKKGHVKDLNKVLNPSRKKTLQGL